MIAYVIKSCYNKNKLSMKVDDIFENRGMKAMKTASRIAGMADQQLFGGGGIQ